MLIKIAQSLAHTALYLTRAEESALLRHITEVSKGWETEQHKKAKPRSLHLTIPGTETQQDTTASALPDNSLPGGDSPLGPGVLAAQSDPFGSAIHSRQMTTSGKTLPKSCMKGWQFIIKIFVACVCLFVEQRKEDSCLSVCRRDCHCQKPDFHVQHCRLCMCLHVAKTVHMDRNPNLPGTRKAPLFQSQLQETNPVDENN